MFRPLRPTIAFCLVTALSARSDAETLTPRAPLPKAPIAPRADGDRPTGLDRRLTVKFDDAARVRARDGRLISSSDATLAAVQTIATAYDLSFHGLLTGSESRVTALQARAADRTGQAQPDLLGIFRIETPAGADLVAIGEALRSLAVVEYVYLETLGEPPPGDILPPTPDHVPQQTYHAADPGIDVKYAWWMGAKGNGVRISDCEYGWVPSHEDLNDINLHPEPGQTPDPLVSTFGWDQHGTAVVGELAAVPNGYGCTGMVPHAEIYTYPEWTLQGGFRRLEAVTNAIADSDSGDIVLLEMQTSGGPAEQDPSIWLVTKMGVDAGVVVVAAAGSGGHNLDGATYSSYIAMGDSGAILVGAGTPDTQHDALWFSSYGQRVNLQGWGDLVFTLGYGTFATYGGDNDQKYTDHFDGTSAAAPFVAAACAAVQQKAVEKLGGVISGRDLRDHLICTGVPQGQGGHIGPLPDLKAALDSIESLTPIGVWRDLGQGLAGGAGTPQLDGSGSLAVGTPWALTLGNASPSSIAALVLGLSRVDLPAYGGTLVPFPDVILFFSTTAAGTRLLTGTTPPTLAPGAKLYFQFWIHDPTAPVGAAASNAVEANAP